MKFKDVFAVSNEEIILMTEDGYYPIINKKSLDTNEQIICFRTQSPYSHMKFMPYEDFKVPTDKEKKDILKALTNAQIRYGDMLEQTEIAMDKYFDKFKKEFPWGDAFDSAYDLQDEESNKKVTKIINQCIEENKTVEELNDKHV